MLHIRDMNIGDMRLQRKKIRIILFILKESYGLLWIPIMTTFINMKSNSNYDFILYGIFNCCLYPPTPKVVVTSSTR